MAATAEHLLLAAVVLGLAWPSLCFHADFSQTLFRCKDWTGLQRKPGVGSCNARFKMQVQQTGNVELEKDVRSSQYGMKELSLLADLPLVRSREELQSSYADHLITPEVFAQLQQGWCVIDNAISPEFAAHVLSGAKMLRNDGFMYRLKEEYAPGRQDDIMPIEQVWKAEWGPVVEEFQGLDEACKLVKGMAGAIARHAQPTDELAWLCPPRYMQLACFAAQGRGYIRHVDNAAHSNPADPQFREGKEGSRVCDRRVTALLYFNDDWKEEDGGYLRLFNPEQGREDQVLATLKPQAGRLVLFDSTRYFHEVMPSFRERWALSAWMTIPPQHPSHPLHHISA